jgi:hypothetical protein
VQLDGRGRGARRPARWWCAPRSGPGRSRFSSHSLSTRAFEVGDRFQLHFVRAGDGPGRAAASCRSGRARSGSSAARIAAAAVMPHTITCLNLRARPTGELQHRQAVEIGVGHDVGDDCGCTNSSHGSSPTISFGRHGGCRSSRSTRGTPGACGSLRGTACKNAVVALDALSAPSHVLFWRMINWSRGTRSDSNGSQGFHRGSMSNPWGT